MEVVVRTVGGVLGRDRTVRVDDVGMSVIEAGRPGRRVRLSPDQNRRIAEAAALVADLNETPAASYPDSTDEAVTEITISTGSDTRRLTVRSGAPSPEPVWHLLDLVEQAAEG